MESEERLQYLEAERQKIWERLTYVESLTEKKTSDYEKEAKLSSDNTKSFESESRAANIEILELLNASKTLSKDLESLNTSISQLKEEITSNATIADGNAKSIEILLTKSTERHALIDSQSKKVEEIFSSIPVYEEKVKNLQEKFTRGDELDSKINTLFKSISDRKKEIDQLYFEIIGVLETDKDGNEVKKDGLKQELERAYESLKSNFSILQTNFNELETDINKKYDTFLNSKKEEIDSLLSNLDEKYKVVFDKIQSLLPNALTTGLSYAYSEKRGNEVLEQEKHSQNFNYAILGLIIISFIPIAFSVYSLYKEVDLQTVIYRIPRLALSILPLYLPILWVAYSSNRKMNLSKRLIEEYSHKEVLSKTFEGLSRQINSIDNEDISFDLKIKLLYNILEVNSENPGKLISDYNKSDHPLMDALDKSVQLTNAVTKLAKIPGFSKLVTSLEKKSNEVLEKQGIKATAGFEIIDKKSDK